jgi:hypothetical protein
LNGEPLPAMSLAAASTRSFVSCETLAPNFDWTNGLSPSFRPERKFALYFESVKSPSSAVCTMSS